MTYDSKEIRTMKFMAWERAKGELRSMTHCFWTNDPESNYEKLNKMIEKFIEKVEYEGLHE